MKSKHGGRGQVTGVLGVGERASGRGGRIGMELFSSARGCVNLRRLKDVCEVYVRSVSKVLTYVQQCRV